MDATSPKNTSGRPRKACQQCGAQKVRCSGQRPLCHRCLRLHRPCSWGPIQRPKAKPSRRNALQSPKASSTQEESQGPLLQGDLKISGSLLSILADHYFAHVYNSHLLFHEASFKRDLREDSLKPHIILSVCALGSMFYQNNEGQYLFKQDGSCRSWAQAAGKLVLSEADNISEDNVVTFINLGTFWYGQGEWRRALFFEGNGVQAAHLLGLSRATDYHGTSIAVETRCRRYWATYLINQLFSVSAYPKISFKSIANIKLPCTEEEFKTAQLPRTRKTLKDTSLGLNVYAQMIRILSIWTSVYAEAKDLDLNIDTRLYNIQKLDSELEQWKAQFPHEFLDTAQHPGVFFTDISGRLLLLLILYHQSKCTLHSSIVPLFSLGTPEERHVYAQKISAQIAFENARSVSEILQSALQNPSSLSKCAGFVGYAAYASTAIQIPFLWCKNLVIRDSTRSNIHGNLKVMKIMGRYWKLTEILEKSVCNLYLYHSSPMTALDDEPKNLDINQLNGQKSRLERARAAILGHNDILWRNGKVSGGDELDDLGLTPKEENPIDSVRSSARSSDKAMLEELFNVPQDPLPMFLSPYGLETAQFYQQLDFDLAHWQQASHGMDFTFDDLMALFPNV